MRVVAFTGMPGSGKSEAVRAAVAKGVPVVSMGDLVRKEVAARGAAPGDETTGRIASEVRHDHGMDAWAVRCVEEIRLHHGDAAIVVVDGVRNWEEVDRFRQELGDRFTLVAITAGPGERFERLRTRGRADDPSDAQQAVSRDERELGWGIAKAIAMADHAVPNEGGLDEFRARIATLVDELLD